MLKNQKLKKNKFLKVCPLIKKVKFNLKKKVYWLNSEQFKRENVHRLKITYLKNNALQVMTAFCQPCHPFVKLVVTT